MTRVLVLIACVAVLAGGAPAAAPADAPGVSGEGAHAPAPVSYAAPLPPPLRVLRGFVPPPSPYAAGHRGVDLAAQNGVVVRAAGTGRVSFAGAVAGRGVVVVVHADGVRTEYEPVRPLVRAGQPVTRGQPIGLLHGRHGTCRPDGCLHWGARRGGRYFDPLALLRPLGPVRLLPWR